MEHNTNKPVFHCCRLICGKFGWINLLSAEKRGVEIRLFPSPLKITLGIGVLKWFFLYNNKNSTGKELLVVYYAVLNRWEADFMEEDNLRLIPSKFPLLFLLNCLNRPRSLSIMTENYAISPARAGSKKNIHSSWSFELAFLFFKKFLGSFASIINNCWLLFVFEESSTLERNEYKNEWFPV